MEENAIKSKPIDKWIPWFFVLFFAVIALLDGIFVTMAVKTQTGVVTENAYEKGLAYDAVLDSAQAQAALGWVSDIQYEDGRVRARLQGKGGAVLENAAVVAKIIRPVQDGYDFELELVDRGGGIYSAPADFPLPGQWNIRIFVTWQGKSYQNSKMIVTR